MSTYTPIATQTLGSAAASVTFSSIPQGYTDLVVVVGSVTFSANSTFYVQYNGDTGANYSSTVLTGDGSSVSSSRTTSANGAQIGASNGQSSSVRQTCIVQLQNYSNGTTYKNALARWSRSDGETAATVSMWRNTNAITSIEIYGGYSNGTKNSNMQTGTTITLYGIQVGDKAQKAQGGNIVVNSGGYIYHAFTSSGTFTPNLGLSADVLVIAGGGGGGRDKGGGGGAGGICYQAGRSLIAQSYPIIVGAGGAGGTGYGGSFLATVGNNSILDTITALGGGFGGTDNTSVQQAAGAGGSSGGATRAGATASATQGNSGGATGYGNNGGSGNDGAGSLYAGGGGGGAGAVGTNAPTSGTTLAAGGAGLNTWSSWASATSTGVSGYYAGGGGAGAYGSVSLTGGVGGAGGGGNAGNYNPNSVGSNAVSSTGSGGGGGGDAANGGKGGSGIVIIRYSA